MWAMTQTELRQPRRDHRTVAMMVMVPLVVFGYAAGIDVTEIKTTVVGPRRGGGGLAAMVVAGGIGA
jgi:ABC-2 type transport system permease protein